MQRRAILAGVAATLAISRRAVAQDSALTVFAAASLTDVFKALAAQWKSRTGHDISFSFAASSILARQIEQGAAVDVFASADEVWMDYLQQRDLIVPDTRVSPIGNTLVLVAPAGQAKPVSLERGTDLQQLLGSDGRIATGDPAHVPVGIYAKQALTWMGQWDAVQTRIAAADSVRAALLLVERGEAPYGIVYGTDAAIDPGVKVVGIFPPASHNPVAYPFAVTRRAAGNSAAVALVEFLAGPEAGPTYRTFGFSALVRN